MKRYFIFLMVCLMMIGQVAFAETVTTQTSPATGVVKHIDRTVATANTANAIVRRDGSGNFAAGTITAGVTGAVTGNVTGLALQGGAAVAATSGAVVIPITNLFSSYTTNATANIAATLADGVAGQMKIIKLTTKDTNDMVITPANLSGGSTVTLDATGDSVILIFSGTEWHIIYTNGAVG